MRISDSAKDQLELDQILSVVEQNCKGAAGISQIIDLSHLEDRETWQMHLSQVHNIVSMKEEGLGIELYPYEDIITDIKLLQKNGYVLESESVIRIGDILDNYQKFDKQFSGSFRTTYSYLYHAIKIEEYQPGPLKMIREVFDVQGNIKPTASLELQRIYKQIDSTTRALNRQFDTVLQKHKKAKLLSDTIESIRNGRRVLVLPVENKRKIPGTIVDQSASGKTVYIEPYELTELNRELGSLDNDLRAELYKILRELSESLRASVGMIALCYDKVGLLDSLHAKALFSTQIGGQLPELVDQPVLSLIDARHPLLILKEKTGHPKTIPFDVDLRRGNRLLLISGPNAGGKSVTLKAVGLLHLMLYHGILIPVDPKSKMYLFEEIFTDIGDQQSIDEGLSTYSSHLNNLKVILDKTNDRSLILLDEIGSGTDPKLGGAIAEGIIRGLIAKRSIGIITTHYSELKVFAFKQKGIINGAMLFDKEHLEPTYKLKVGKPGSSYAFEVANKVGLDQRAIKYARRKVGKKENQIEDLLVDLQESKVILDEQLDWIKQEKTRLDRLVKNYDQLSKEFQVKRKKLQIRAKELELNKANDENIELQNLIKKLEKEKNLEKARAKKKNILAQRAQGSSELMDLKKEVYKKNPTAEKINKGDFVRMLEGEMSGEVLDIKGDKAQVLFGVILMEVALTDVVLDSPHMAINRKKGINVKGVAFQNNFSPKLDIRGYKLNDAKDTLELFFDQALLNSAKTLEVVHGKGSGALRKLVISKMKEYKDFKSYYHPEDQYGGNGVTFIRL